MKNFDQLSVLKVINKSTVHLENDLREVKDKTLLLDERYMSNIELIHYRKLHRLTKEQLVTMITVYSDCISHIIEELNENECEE